MKHTTILMSTVALLALCACSATSWAQNMNETNAVKPGEQVLMTAELPFTLGKWNWGESMDLGGENPIDETRTETVKYWFFMPVDETEKTDAGFPLLLFLHGAGERGDNADAVKIHGPVKYCADPEKAKTWKFVTVSPQAKDRGFWSPAQLRVLVDRICEQYPIDRSRIYVTGLSMGGFGTWGMVAHHADIVAAAAPICGGYPLEFAPKMTKTPIWAFHGTADEAVKYEYSSNLVDKVRELGNKDVIFTTYPDAGHDVWTRTYENPMLYDWLLSKQLPPTITGPNTVPGKQVLMKAELPANLSELWRGPDRIDPEQKESVSFWAFEPSDVSAKNEAGFPLMVFMHGIGECGDNPQLLKKYGPPKLCDDPEIAKTWKFFTVSPQCKRGVRWSALQIMELIDEVCAKYPIDKSRIYVTGVSLGGMGTYSVAAIGAGKIAAIAPVCGRFDTANADSMTMPVWAFHGADDPLVKLEDDQALIDAIKQAGNDDAKITVYPGVGHNCWDLAYAEEELYEWLLTKSLNE